MARDEEFALKWEEDKSVVMFNPMTDQNKGSLWIGFCVTRAVQGDLKH